MSIRSAANSNQIFNNLTVNGKLTLMQPLTYEDFEVDNLNVTIDTSLNMLYVAEQTTLNMLQVTGDTSLNTLDVSGQCIVNDLTINGKLVLAEPITYTDFQVDNLIVTVDCSLNMLDVSGSTILNTLQATGDCSLNVLDVSGNTTLNNVTIKGVLTLDQELTYQNLEVDNLTINNDCSINILDVSGNTTLNTLNVTGLTTLSTLTVTGVTTLTNTQSDGFMYFQNSNSVIPENYGSAFFGAIGANMTAGMAEVDFVNTGLTLADGNLSAFDWLIMSSATTTNLLMRLYNTGMLYLYNTLNVTGDLYVSGLIHGNPANMEMVTYNLGGSAGQVVVTLPLSQNTTQTTNYAVFTSIYDGYSGSGGTYSPADTAGAIGSIVISNRTTDSFVFNLEKATGDNVNAYLVFMVVYGVTGCNYPTSY